MKSSGHLFDNKILLEIQILQDNLGLDVNDSSQRMIYRAISKLRTDFVDEIPNYHHFFVPFLAEYNEANPDTLSIVQVGTKIVPTVQ